MMREVKEAVHTSCYRVKTVQLVKYNRKKKAKLASSPTIKKCNSSLHCEDMIYQSTKCCDFFWPSPSSFFFCLFFGTLAQILSVTLFRRSMCSSQAYTVCTESVMYVCHCDSLQLLVTLSYFKASGR